MIKIQIFYRICIWVCRTTNPTFPTTAFPSFIADNTWLCSPKLSWMYSWSRRYTAPPSPVLRRVDDTRCRYDAARGARCLKQNQCGSLLLVAQYYHERVNPSCPSACACVLTNVQARLAQSNPTTQATAAGVKS